MPANVRGLFERAQAITQDVLGTRWPLPELAQWFNDGCRELAVHKPSAVANPEVMDLVEGTRQQLSDDAVQVLRVPRNLKSGSTDENRIGGRAIRIVDREVLDRQQPDWHDDEGVSFAATVKHVVFDDNDPRGFYVYPGNTGEGLVEALVARTPELIDEAGEALADYDTVELPVPTVYFNALLDYVLYRVFSKDAADPGNATRAGAHYQAFTSAVGIKMTNEGTRDD